MPTSEERREVAARLREDAGCSESSPREVVERYIGVEYDGEDVLEESYTSESLLHLADLIEPEKEDTDEDSQYRGTSLCSVCGELLISQFRYCPHCGARVVDKDDD